MSNGWAPAFCTEPSHDGGRDFHGSFSFLFHRSSRSGRSHRLPVRTGLVETHSGASALS